MKSESTNPRAYVRVLGLCCIALSGIISTKNFNAGLLFAIIGGYFFIQRFGLLEYILISFLLLIKSQSNVVLSSQDLASYVEIYNSIGQGGNPFEFFGPGEILLTSLFWFFSRFIPSITVHYMSFCFVLVFMFLFYPVARYFRRRPLVAFILTLFIDVNLIVHLFRQNVASLIFLSGFLVISRKRAFARARGLALILISGFFHLTSFLFAPLSTLFSKISTKILKIYVMISALFGLLLIHKEMFLDYMNFVYGIPILEKASYAAYFFDSEGGLRIIALVAATVALLVNDDSPFFKIFLGFSGLALLAYQIPIVAPRIGLIATSILTGLPIGIALDHLRKRMATIVSPYFDNQASKSIEIIT